MRTAQAQEFIYDRLVRSRALRGLPVMKQLPDNAKAADLEAAEREFEAHLQGAGLVIVAMRPELRSTGTLASGSGVALQVCVPVALTENRTVNLSDTGARRDCGELVDDILAATLCDGVTYPPGEIGQADLGDGLSITYLQPHVRCVVRAAREE